jgi:hypothetical protein
MQVYQQDVVQTSPNVLFEHVFGDLAGVLVTFTGRMNRTANELTAIEHQFYRYPEERLDAAAALLAASESRRDAYYGVHLYQAPGNRRSDNAAPLVHALWLDEDDGTYPTTAPSPTAIVHSSRGRRHLYWRLSYPVDVDTAVAMNRRIAALADGDTGKAGKATVLRPPRTRNYKRSSEGDEVTSELADVAAWDPHVLDAELPQLPQASADSAPVAYDGPELHLGEYLDGVTVRYEAPDTLGRKFAIVCPWSSDHSGDDASGTYVGQRENGGLWFHCNHQHCVGRGWSDFRQIVRPVRALLIRIPKDNPTKLKRVRHHD